MRTIYVILFAAFIFIYGCTIQPNKTTNSSLPILDVSKEYPEIKIDIHELGEVEYIPLETTDESVMSTPCKYKISEKYIIVKDIDILYFFDRKGKYLYKINHRGGGPKEYHYINNHAVDFETEEIYIEDSKKIQVYSFAGEWKRTLSIPKGIYWEYLFNCNEHHLIATNVYHDYFNPDNMPEDNMPFYLINKENGGCTPLPINIKQRVSRIVNKGREDLSETIGRLYTEKILIESMHANSLDILIADFGLDTLYSFKKDQLKSIAVQYPPVHSSNPPIVIAPILYTDQLFIFKPVEIKYDPKYVLAPLANAPTLIWNRQTNDIHRVKIYDSNRPEKNINIDMWDVQFESPNHFVFNLFPYKQLCPDYENGKLKGELKDIASNLTEEDNNIVVICKLKDK